MLTKNQVEILNLFRKDIFLESSILKITEKLNKKSYPGVYNSIKEFEKNNILKIKKMGNANIISLLLTPQSISQIAFLDEQETMNKSIPNYDKIVSIKEISQYLILITGSYAKSKATKKSDLDLVIIIPDNQKTINIQKLVENITLVYHPKVHLYVFNNKDFIEMLLDKKENYGKEIFKNHMIIKNAYIYYDLLKEAIENGLRN